MGRRRQYILVGRLARSGRCHASERSTGSTRIGGGGDQLAPPVEPEIVDGVDFDAGTLVAGIIVSGIGFVLFS